MLRVTNARVHIIPKGEGKLRALAAATIEGAIVIRDLRVFEGEKGLFVAMPSRTSTTGECQEIVYPLTEAMHNEIRQKVLAEYAKEKGTR
jgi:stage V sporulation protein G